ncbi:MAG: DUF6602 domain-containing protein [Breznakibacter sp.]
MKLKLFNINESVTLKSDGTPYLVVGYTDEYCEAVSSWKVKCIIEYSDNEANYLYEYQFVEFAQKYYFRPPGRKPSLTTQRINRKIENIFRQTKDLDKYLHEDYQIHRGLYKESLIRDLIIELLSEDFKNNKSVQVGTGFISDKPKHHTNQLDVIVYFDEEGVTKFDSLVLVPPQLTIAVIEIKTKIDSKQLLTKDKKIGALENQYIISKYDTMRGRHITKCIIGFEKGFKRNRTFENCIETFYNNHSIDNSNIFKTLPDLIGTLDGFCVFFGTNVFSKPALFYSNSDEGISSFQAFYHLMLKSITENFELFTPNAKDYLNMLPHEDHRDDDPLGIANGIEIKSG